MTVSNLKNLPVLIVEDEYLIAMELIEQLEMVGAHVLGPVSSVEDALKLISDHSAISVAVLDCNLRGDLCYPVADALQARRIPFVFTSGYSADEFPEKYAGVPLLGKPFSASEVVARLESLVREAVIPSRA
jgi:DNA-binding response OmpR family regulator